MSPLGFNGPPSGDRKVSIPNLPSRRYGAFIASAIFLMIMISSAYQYSQYTAFHLQHVDNTSKPDLLDDIGNRTLGFQKIFIINLAQRTDLRDAVTLAASFTDLDIEFVDGVLGADVADKSLPPGGEEAHLKPGGLGNWRAHMNVARIIVEQNLQSALVLENDADWDLRIKSQMRDFARASRLLLQPLRDGNGTFLDPTNPIPGRSDQATSFELMDPADDPTVAPTTSPYGDLNQWDMFWLGHCGCRFPWARDGNAPLGRAVIPNDETVPEPQHINIEFGDRQLIDQYPAHTRVVSRARVNSCTLGHAFSQQGAKKFLYELGLRKLSDTTDMAFRSMCDGVSERPLAVCLTVQPQLFQHHRPRGLQSGESDIDDHGSGFNEHAHTDNVRWSTRVNFPRLVQGRTDYIDPYPDGKSKAVWPEGI